MRRLLLMTAIERYTKHADACHVCGDRPLTCKVGQALLGIASGMRRDPAPAGQVEMAPVVEAVEHELDLVLQRDGIQGAGPR